MLILIQTYIFIASLLFCTKSSDKVRLLHISDILAIAHLVCNFTGSCLCILPFVNNNQLWLADS